MDILQRDITMLPLSQLVPNAGQIAGVPTNPRLIKGEKFEALKKSLQKANHTGVHPLKVYDVDGAYVVLGGNMRLRALQDLGVQEVACIIIPDDASEEDLRQIVIEDNSQFGEWDNDMLANEWGAQELAEWGVDVPTFEEQESNDEIARKEAEFRERMAAGEISEEDEEYQEFLDKFKLKKTTDDCYTPAVVYDAVADYVAKTYGVNKKDFVRPFYPGGDYTKERYPKGCVVVDNPPFSILAEILQYYKQHNIAFFLFAPTLTLFSSSSSSSSCALCAGVAITYENGAAVNTSFLTSFDAEETRLCSCPELYAAAKEANDKNLEQLRKQLPKYEYPLEVVTSTKVAQYSRLGVEFSVPKKESVAISRLDEQKEKDGSVIYGKGYLVSRAVLAERERAERERAERWHLSEREIAIVNSLGK